MLRPVLFALLLQLEVYFKMKVMSWVKSSVFLMLWVLSWQRYVHCFTSWKKIEEEST